jgi:cold shock CspA family protein
MNTLADQLKALGMQPTKGSTPDIRTATSEAGGRPPGSGEKPPSAQGMLYLQLPRFGTVARLEEERGFGLISVSGSEDVFFHVRGFPGRLPNGQKLPQVGASVLFITV